MKTYETVTEAVADLQQRGYTAEFKMEHDCLSCEDQRVSLRPDEFKIDEVYRFEGITDPGDEMIVCAISSTNGAVRGTLVNAYGTYADTASDEMISKLSV